MINPIIKNIVRPLITSAGIIAPDFHYPMGGALLNRYKSAGSSRHAKLSSPIPLQPGDTIEFTYDAIGAMGSNKFFIYSSTGAANVGYFGSGSGSHGNAQLSNFTCTMNGVAVVGGDDLIDNNPTQFPITGYKPIRIVLTATAETDIEYILAKNTGASVMNMDFYNLKVVTGAQIYEWPMSTIASATQAEANSDPINVVFTANDPAYWMTWPFDYNLGTNTDILQHITSSDINGGDKLLQQPSIRDDLTGNSTGFPVSSAEYYLTRGNVSIPYAGGFTIQVRVRYKGHYDGAADGSCCGVIQSLSNSGEAALWALRFDNFHNAALDDVFACFTLLGRDIAYHQADIHWENIEADVRSSTAAVVDEIVTLTATIRPSTNDMEFWVEDVSQGTASIDPDWYDSAGNPAKDLLDGSMDTIIRLGPSFVDGSWQVNQLSEIQDAKIFLLEADQAFVNSQL